MTDVSPELAELQQRVAKGIEWLAAHDPTGAFHLWFGYLTPNDPMPAQDEERRQAYREYHQARTLWERLWRAMVRLEKKEAAKP